MCGCVTVNNQKDALWIMPAKPTPLPVQFEPIPNGFFLSSCYATNLANNVDELKAYSLKLEALIDAMQKYHNNK